MENISEKKTEIKSRIQDLESKDFNSSKWSSDVINRLIDLSSRGKMFRGITLMRVSESLDGPKATDYAAAIELVHTGLLIHDDVMDEDSTRRGKKSLHKQYEDKLGADPKFGRDMAVCAGDIAFFLAFDLMSDSDNFEPEAAKVFSEVFCKTGIGQMKDIEASVTGKELSKSEIEMLYTNKTALYSFSLPLQLGAIVAGRGGSEKLDEIGREIGVLYQLKDDSLDLFGEDKEIGKPSKSDILENKKTLHRRLLIERSNNPEEIKKLFKGDTSSSDVEKILELMRRHSIGQKVDEEISSRKKELIAIIGSLDNQELEQKLLETVELCLGSGRERGGSR